MTKPRKLTVHPTLKEFTPGRGYTREDWDAVESPEMTEEEMRTARPFAEAFPELAEAIRRSKAGDPASE